MPVHSMALTSLLDDQRIEVPLPSRALRSLAEVMHAAVQTLRKRNGHSCGIAHLAPGNDPFPALIAATEIERQIRPVSPFEGTDRIAGALWALDEFDDLRGDGIAKLIFQPDTLELPAHVHEHSERAIYVLHGTGNFYVTDETLDSFSGQTLRRHDVRPGTLLTFSRGLMHTFASGPEELTLVSYQSPAMAFDDPAQYTVPKCRWQPSR